MEHDRFGLRTLQRLFKRPEAAPSQGGSEAQVLAIASGKGGTGKSFFTTNLAISLHRRGLRVAVVDCDFGLGNAHLLFGVNPRLTVFHLLQGSASVAEVLTATPHGPSLIAGGSGISSLAELDQGRLVMLARSFGWLAQQHDVVLLDCAAGLSPQSLLTILAAQELILVTNPEIAALTDAYALIKCLSRQKRGPRIHVTVNRSLQPGQGEATFERLADVAHRFAGLPIHYIGEIPEDPSVTHRRLGQPPLSICSPECPTAQALEANVTCLERRLGSFQQVSTRLQDGVEQRLLAVLKAR